MPSYSGVWSLEAQYQAQGSGNWPLRLNFISIVGSTGNEYSVGIRATSSGGFYTCGRVDTGGYISASIINFTNTGNIAWQQAVSFPAVSNTYVTPYAMTLDSSGNILMAGYSGVPGFEVQQLMKFDSAGNITWQKRLGVSPTSTAGFGVATDTSNNVLVVGRTQVSGEETMLLDSYDSSGNLSWQRGLFTSTRYSNLYAVATNSTGDVFAVGQSLNSTGTSSQMVTVKYNSSGTIQWQRALGSGASDSLSAVAVDSSSNAYVTGTVTGNGGDLFLAKYNTSNVLQWQRRLGNAVTDDSGRCVVVDSSNDIYVGGYTAVSGKGYFIVAKYNPSGVIQWQRTLGSTSGDSILNSIALDTLGNMYLSGYTYVDGTATFLNAKLPNDGSKTGSYVLGAYTFVYAVSSVTEAAASLTDSAGSLTGVTPSLSSVNTALSNSPTFFPIEIAAV